MATSQILARKTPWADKRKTSTAGMTQLFASSSTESKGMVIHDRAVGAIGFANTATRLVIGNCPTLVKRDAGNTIAFNYGDTILNVHELGPASLGNIPYVQGAGTFDVKWPNAKIPTALFTKETHPNGDPFTGVTNPHFVFYPKLMVIHAGCAPFTSTGLDALDADKVIDGLADDGRELLRLMTFWATEEGALALEESQQAYEYLLETKKKGTEVPFAFPTGFDVDIGTSHLLDSVLGDTAAFDTLNGGFDATDIATHGTGAGGGGLVSPTPGGQMTVKVSREKSRDERAEDVAQAQGRNAVDGVLGIVGSYTFAADGPIRFEKKNFGTPTAGYSAAASAEGLSAKANQLRRLLDANMGTEIKSGDRLVTERNRKCISDQMVSLLVKGTFHKEHISTSNPVSLKALSLYHWFPFGPDIIKGIAADMAAVAGGRLPSTRSGVELISSNDQVCAAIANIRSDVHALYQFADPDAYALCLIPLERYVEMVYVEQMTSDWCVDMAPKMAHFPFVAAHHLAVFLGDMGAAGTHFQSDGALSSGTVGAFNWNKVQLAFVRIAAFFKEIEKCATLSKPYSLDGAPAWMPLNLLGRTAPPPALPPVQRGDPGAQAAQRQRGGDDRPREAPRDRSPRVEAFVPAGRRRSGSSFGAGGRQPSTLNGCLVSLDTSFEPRASANLDLCKDFLVASRTCRDQEHRTTFNTVNNRRQFHPSHLPIQRWSPERVASQIAYVRQHRSKVAFFTSNPSVASIIGRENADLLSTGNLFPNGEPQA